MATAASSAPAPTDLTRLAAAAASAPGDVQARRALAVGLARAGRPREALGEYRAVLALRPNDPDAAADAGLMARRCGLEEEVLPLLVAAAEANPRHARLWQVLGLVHRALDQLGPAVAALERASALAPNEPLIAHGRARTTYEAGLPAVRLFERAIALAPADLTLRLGLVAALVSEGRWRDAAAGLESGLSAEPGWIAGHAALARLLWEMGEGVRFMESILRALAAQPANLELWREAISLPMLAGRLGEALEIIARGKKVHGDDPLFIANEAACRAELGKTAAADRLFARVEGLNDATVMVRLVRHLLRSGRPDEAGKRLEPWLSTPTAFMFWPYASLAWRLTGDPRWAWLEGDERLVGIYDLSTALPSLDALADRLRTLHRSIGQPLEQSVRGGTQTDGILLVRAEPEIVALRAAIVEAVRTHVAQLPPADAAHPQLGPPRAPIRFSGSWSVRLTGGGHHANHIHPAGWFSSALYIALPDRDERGPEPAGWLILGEPQAELMLDLPSVRLVEPKPGRLVLFPSTMWHGTRPFGAGERLTVAFDVAVPPS